MIARLFMLAWPALLAVALTSCGSAQFGGDSAPKTPDTPQRSAQQSTVDQNGRSNGRDQQTTDQNNNGHKTPAETPAQNTADQSGKQDGQTGNGADLANAEQQCTAEGRTWKSGTCGPAGWNPDAGSTTASQPGVSPAQIIQTVQTITPALTSLGSLIRNIPSNNGPGNNSNDDSGGGGGCGG